MTFTAGSVPSTANPAKDVMDALHPLLTAGGLTFVEDWTSGAETVKVYKSALAANTVGDWYLFVRRTADNAVGIFLTVSEAWDATNKKLQRYVPSATSPVPSAAAAYTINDATGQLPNTTASIAYLSLNTAGVSAGATAYWASVNSSRVVVATRVSATDSGIYAGLCDEILPGSVAGAGMPLGVFAMTGGTLAGGGAVVASNGGYTREPNTSSGAAGNFASPIASNPWGFSNATADALYTTRLYAARAWTGSARTTGAQSPRTLLKDVLYIAGLSTAAVNGDTATYGGKTWMKMAVTNQVLFVDQAA